MFPFALLIVASVVGWTTDIAIVVLVASAAFFRTGFAALVMGRPPDRGIGPVARLWQQRPRTYN